MTFVVENPCKINFECRGKMSLVIARSWLNFQSMEMKWTHVVAYQHRKNFSWAQPFCRAIEFSLGKSFVVDAINQAEKKIDCKLSNWNLWFLWVRRGWSAISVLRVHHFLLPLQAVPAIKNYATFSSSLSHLLDIFDGKTFFPIQRTHCRHANQNLLHIYSKQRENRATTDKSRELPSTSPTTQQDGEHFSIMMDMAVVRSEGLS